MTGSEENRSAGTASGQSFGPGERIHERYFQSPGLIANAGRPSVAEGVRRFHATHSRFLNWLQRRWACGFNLPNGWIAPVYSPLFPWDDTPRLGAPPRFHPMKSPMTSTMLNL